jgi:1,4-alpha-glucan branching enzyme
VGVLTIANGHAMGASLTADGCWFRVWAPNASRVAVMGDFNDWGDAEFVMNSHSDGVWSVAVPGVRAGDEYLYVIDNRGGDEFNPGQRGLRRIDPWARATRGSGGNAVVVDVAGELLASGLADDPFVTPAISDWLIYQVHVGSFVGGGDSVDTGPTATGTFAQFEQKLAYIRELGFNAIVLLPVHQNPGDGNEGYGPSHLFAPESSYGSPADLRHLVRAAHDAGLAVLFDVVWNHMSDFDNRLWDFDGMTRDGGVFFEDGERSPWGPRLAFWKIEVRDMIVANARMWFEEYHADGLRVDAADEISRDVLREVVQVIRADIRWHSRMFVAEWIAVDSTPLQSLLEQIGFDRIWALGDPHIFLAALHDAGHQNIPSRAARIEELIRLPHGDMRIRYLLGSHDTGHDNQSGGRAGFRHFVELAGGRDTSLARAQARMGWLLCVALPGTPMCFMGAECLQAGYWHPRPDQNVAHGDHRFDWRACADPLGHEMRALVTAANEIRWQHPALRDGRLEVVHFDEENDVVVFRRDGRDGDAVLVVIHAGASSWAAGEYRLPMPHDDRTWRTLIDSQSPEFGGDRSPQPVTISRTDDSLSLGLSQWSVMLLGTA